MNSSPLRRIGARGKLAASGLALSLLFAAPAAADATTTNTNMAVAGTTASTLALTVPTAAAMTLTPGQTATGTGTLSIVSTLGAWTLGVSDTTDTPAGHLVAGTGCTGSESSLTHAASVTATGTLGTVTSSGSVTISGTNQQVASGSGTANLSTAYSNVIDSTENLKAGCIYNMTATYTLQS